MSDLSALTHPGERRSGLLLIEGARLVGCHATHQSGLAHQQEGATPTALLIGGGHILGLLSAANAARATEALEPLGCLSTLDATGLLAVPGFIDLHVHLCGGGGEAGPASKTPEALLSALLLGGVTTVVGVTGTDSVTRCQEALVSKAAALAQDGLTAMHWCGSYSLPPATATGSVQRDLCLLRSCVGVGEVAVSDHRGSAPSALDLARLALDARVGGMLGGKAGIVHCHVGRGAARLQPLRDALAAGGGDVPITAFHPTHIDRSPELAEEGARWLADGGTLDLTCSNPDGCRDALRLIRQRSQSLLQGVTLSTDAYGSLPVFDATGRLVRYDVAEPGAMLQFVRRMVQEEGWGLGEVLALVTRNPARILQLVTKGVISVGYDADILLLQEGTLELQYVVARGEVVKTPQWVRGGTFERGPGIRPRPPILPQRRG